MAQKQLKHVELANEGACGRKEGFVLLWAIQHIDFSYVDM
jgi:hypothetical protein